MVRLARFQPNAKVAKGATLMGGDQDGSQKQSQHIKPHLLVNLSSGSTAKDLTSYFESIGDIDKLALQFATLSISTAVTGRAF